MLKGHALLYLGYNILYCYIKVFAVHNTTWWQAIENCYLGAILPIYCRGEELPNYLRVATEKELPNYPLQRSCRTTYCRGAAELPIAEEEFNVGAAILHDQSRWLHYWVLLHQNRPHLISRPVVK